MIARRIRVYGDRHHLEVAGTTALNDILAGLWSIDAGKPLGELANVCGEVFEPAERPEQADLYLLSLKWNSYVESRRVDLAMRASRRAESAHKPFVIFSAGDSPANVPVANAVVFETSGYRSRIGERGNRLFALPAFVSDYLRLYCGGELKLRPKAEKPVVGFCGQGAGGPIDFLRREAVRRMRWVAYRLGLRRWEPAPFETVRWRSRVLRTIAQCPSVRTLFQPRRRYRAGYLAKPKDPFHPSRLEFIENILQSDYTVCTRGGGNFSQRFYEVLSLGRIPVFVDTDCLLPYQNVIDYRRYCVWISEADIRKTPSIIGEFHQALSAEAFEDLQQQCRRLWLERLSRDGFYRHFGEHFPELLDSSKSRLGT